MSWSALCRMCCTKSQAATATVWQQLDLLLLDQPIPVTLLASTLQDELHESQAETATAWQKLGSLSERAAATEKELNSTQAAASEAEAASSKQIQQLKVGGWPRCTQGCLTLHSDEQG